MEIAPNFSNWLKNDRRDLKAILFDIDGTLIRGRMQLPGAGELLRYLDERELPYLLLTNDAVHSHQEKCKYLHRAGLNIAGDRIVSSGDVIEQAIEENNLDGEMFFIMGDLGFPNYAENAGIVVTREFIELPNCRGVIIGETNYNWEPTFNAVINYFIDNPAGILMVPNPDIYWPNQRKGISIGAGGKARFICSILEEYGLKIKPVYLGKPYTALFDYAGKILAARHNLADTVFAEKIMVLGDSLFSDIKGANNSGHLSGLLLTGITTLEAVKKIDPGSDRYPDYIFRNL